MTVDIIDLLIQKMLKLVQGGTSVGTMVSCSSKLASGGSQTCAMIETKPAK